MSLRDAAMADVGLIRDVYVIDEHCLVTMMPRHWFIYLLTLLRLAGCRLGLVALLSRRTRRLMHCFVAIVVEPERIDYASMVTLRRNVRMLLLPHMSYLVIDGEWRYRR